MKTNQKKSELLKQLLQSSVKNKIITSVQNESMNQIKLESRPNWLIHAIDLYSYQTLLDEYENFLMSRSENPNIIYKELEKIILSKMAIELDYKHKTLFRTHNFMEIDLKTVQEIDRLFSEGNFSQLYSLKYNLLTPKLLSLYYFMPASKVTLILCDTPSLYQQKVINNLLGCFKKPKTIQLLQYHKVATNFNINNQDISFSNKIDIIDAFSL